MPESAVAVVVTSSLPLAEIIESKTNPRRAMNKAALDELTESVRRVGVVQPVLVRPLPGGPYELVAGHRRLAAARAAGLTEIPVTVRDLTDTEGLEIQLVENLQRADLHALEEAEGYRRLTAVAKESVPAIAARVGKSFQYVYDRLRLNELTKEAKALFLEDRFTTGHAVLLARLKPADQARALDPQNNALFTGEHLLWHPNDGGENNYATRSQSDAGLERVKPRSVRELQGWIDKHVRFDAKAKDVPDLFPETKRVVDQAGAIAEKILPITYEQHVVDEAKDGNRVWGPRSWKKVGEKPCDHAVTGVVVIGPARGEAFRVCVEKKKCGVHWAKELREAKARAKTGAKHGQDSDAFRAAEARQHAESERREIERARWKKAAPALRAAAIEAVKTAKVSALGTLLLDGMHVTPVKGSVRGTSADDLVRYLATGILAGRLNEWSAEHNGPRIAKALGIDLKKLLDDAAPAPKAEAAAAPKPKPTKKAKRK